jgi:hypothetical protein
LISQCVTPSGSTTNASLAECEKKGYCKSDSTTLYYNIKEEVNCNKPSNFGVCEVCDEGNHCLKLPIGDYCQVADEKLQSFIGFPFFIYFLFYYLFILKIVLMPRAFPRKDLSGTKF